MQIHIILIVCLIHYNLALNKSYEYQNRTRRWLKMSRILPQHPDVGLTVPELIVRYGYKAETHTISTDDNYILTLHRIPYGRFNSQEKNRPVVFLMHGLLASSADWVLMGPKQGLAYLLADLGYDVWMGNARGNIYSRQHRYFIPDQNVQFWNFSWHEIGLYDLPKMIDSVLQMTKQKKLSYIGHSQGCTIFFVMISLLPEFNKKIRIMFALAPAVYMKHLASPVIQTLVYLKEPLELILESLGKYEFLPSTEFKKVISTVFCDKISITQDICSNTMFLLSGFDEEQLNKTMVPIMLVNTPAGSATKQLIHFAQEVLSDRFRQFDYGTKQNMITYGFSEPPDYNLTKVTVPVALIYGKNDLLVASQDVKRLAKVLPNVVVNYLIPYNKFSHLDFLWANDVVPILYNFIFKILRVYNK